MRRKCVIHGRLQTCPTLPGLLAFRKVTIKAILLSLLVLMSTGLVSAGEPKYDLLGDPLPGGVVQRLGTTRMRTSLRDFCYLPDGRAVVVSGGYAHIWDLAAGRVQESTKVSDAYVMSVVCHPQKKVLLLTDSSGKVFEWDWEGKVEPRGWQTGQGGLLYACYSPDCRRVLSSGNPPTIKEWELESGRQLVAIESELVTTRCGAIYGPNGKTAILGGGYDHNLEHYDLATGKLLRKWCSIYEAKDLALSPDQKSITLGVEDRALEWSLEDYTVLHNYKHCPGEAGRIFSVAYLPHTNQVLCGGRDWSLHRWDRETGQRVFSWTPHQGPVTRLCVSPDQRWALSYGSNLLIETSIATGEPRLKWDRHTGSVEAAAFLPAGQHVVSASSDATLRVWDTASGETVQPIRGAKLGAYAVDVSPDGKRIVAGCKDGIVREFAVAGGTLLRELTGHRGYVRAVKYTHDASRLISSAGDGSIRMWAPDMAEPVTILRGHRGGVLALDISPDDQRVASGGRDGTVRVWDAATGKLLQTHVGHRGWVECVLFLPDGMHVLSAGRDGRILQWALNTGNVVKEFAHDIWIEALASTPDGSRVLSAGQAGAVTCWDLGTGKKTGSLAGHREYINALAVSPDGRQLLSGSNDGTLLVWELP